MINGVIYNNGKNFKYILPGEEIPTGFVLGKIQIHDDNGNKKYSCSGKKYGFDIINNERIKLGLLPLDEKYRNTMISSEKLCKSISFDIFSTNIEKEIQRVQEIIKSHNFIKLTDFFIFYGLSSTNRKNIIKYKNFMNIIL